MMSKKKLKELERKNKMLHLPLSIVIRMTTEGEGRLYRLSIHFLY